MKQKEAKILIIREWDHWIQSQSIYPSRPTGRDSLKFFHGLQDAKSPLLNFQYRGRDKWQIVHDWLLSAQRIKDSGGTE
jgi:hypothetical protein